MARTAHRLPLRRRADGCRRVDRPAGDRGFAARHTAMSGRITRLLQRTGLNMLLAQGRKPRVLPMSREESRILAELQRRRDQRRKKDWKA